MKQNSIIASIWVFCLLPFALQAQNGMTEKEIKRSNQYFWGQSFGGDTVKARLDARDALMANISTEIGQGNAIKDKATISVNYIRYFQQPVEDDCVMIVAYVPKTNVTYVLDNKESLIVNEIKYTEANAIQKKVPKEVASQTKETATNKDGEVPKVVTTITDTNSQNIGNTKTVSSDLLSQLIACNTAEELGKILVREKGNNTLIYSANSPEFFKKNMSSELFYVILIDKANNKIVSFFDKGGNERKDLKFGGTTSDIEGKAKNYIQVWVQLF